MKKLILIFAVFATSFSAVFIRYSTAPSLVMVLYRMGISAILMTVFVLWKSREELKALKFKDIYPCVFSGFFLAAHFATYFASLDHTSISASTVLANLEIFFVAIGSFLVLRQPISKHGWLGIAVTFIGSLIVAGSGLRGGGSNELLGDALAFLAACLMGVYTMLGTICQRKLSTMVYTWIVYTAATLLVAIILLIKGESMFGYGEINLLTSLGLAVVCTLLGHSLFSLSLRSLPAAYVSVVKMLAPVFASVQGIILFSEMPKLNVILGGLIVIGGIVYYSIYEKGLIPEKNQVSE